MEPQRLALFFALGSALVFGVSSLVFAEYSRRVSALWMNAFKAVVALLLFGASVLLFGHWIWPTPHAASGLLASGFIGLCIGDLFLLEAFARLGAGRTLILFGFSPLIVGTGAAIAFGQRLEPSRFLAVIFLIGCLFSFSLEKYRAERKWELRGLAFALVGVCLDACGILLTRWSFSHSPELSSLQGNFWRCLGAVAGFGMIHIVRPLHLWTQFSQWQRRERFVIVIASIGGTFLSLILYVSAIKYGHLASITAISITGPMFATFLECALHRTRPSRYLLAALAFFSIGFWILVIRD